MASATETRTCAHQAAGFRPGGSRWTGSSRVRSLRSGPARDAGRPPDHRDQLRRGLVVYRRVDRHAARTVFETRRRIAGRDMSSTVHDERRLGQRRLDEARHPQTLLAWGMNGGELPVPFGGPLRMRVPRQLGYKSAKYINRLVVTDSLPVSGRQGVGRRRGWLLLVRGDLIARRLLWKPDPVQVALERWLPGQVRRRIGRREDARRVDDLCPRVGLHVLGGAYPAGQSESNDAPERYGIPPPARVRAIRN